MRKNSFFLFSPSESVHVSLMIFIVASVGQGFYSHGLFSPPTGDAVKAEPALIKTPGQLFAGSNGFS